MNYFLAYITTLISFAILDSLWILVFAKEFYTNQIGFLFSKSINFVPVAFFYPLYAFGVLMFVVIPAVSSASWIDALWRGALLGLIAYGAYDLTNHATIAHWPLLMTIVDMAWGMMATALAGFIVYFIIVAFK